MNDEKILIQKCTERLLRSETYRIFGLELLNHDIILTDQVPSGAATSTDFKRIFINPNDSFFQYNSTDKRYLYNFVLCHESGHNILMHDKRLGNRDPILWGYSIDYMLNLLLYHIEKENVNWDPQKNLIKFDISNFSTKILFDQSFEGMLEEEIYNKLQKDGSYTKTNQYIPYKQFLNDVGIPSDNVSDDQQIEIIQTELTYNGKTRKKTFINFPKSEYSPSSNNNEIESDRQLIKSMFESNILSKGFENKEFEKFLRRRFNIKVPWETILRDSILIELEKSSNISYGRPRFSWLCQPSLPYLPNYEEEEKLGTLVILIDESASMNDKDIENAIDIVIESDSYYKNVYVIKHDVRVSWEKFYPDKLTKNDIDELLVRRHCGGTSHKDAFEKVLQVESKTDCNVSLVLSITDMASDIEYCQNILPDRLPRIYLQNDSTWNYGNVKGKVIKLTTST